MNALLVALWAMGLFGWGPNQGAFGLHRVPNAVAGPKESEEREGHSELTGGQAALEYRWNRRRGSDGTIPAGALLKAKAQADLLPTLGNGMEDDAGIWRWDWLGPNNIGGRTRTILFNGGQTVWTGGVSGGIWKSTDMAAHWSGTNDFLASLQITSMSSDRALVNIMYAATGEDTGYDKLSVNGAGVFRSLDGGVTWNQLPATANWVAVTRVLGHPQMDSVVFATVSGDPVNKGLWRSSDHGDTWTKVLSTTGDAKDVKIGRDNAANVLVGTTNGVFLSRSNGQPGTFVTLTTNRITTLPAGTGRWEVAFGKGTTSGLDTMWASKNKSGGELYRSVDDGHTWEMRSTGVGYLSTQGEYGNSVWASPDDPNLVVVGGVFVWRSTDGGTNFSIISNYNVWQACHPDVHAIVEAPLYGPNNRAVYFATDGGICKAYDITTASTSGGWIAMNNGLGITQFYKGATRDNGEAMLGGTQDNLTPLFLRPLSPTWGYTGPLGDGGYCIIDSFHPKLWVTTQNLRIYRSDDGNQTWTEKTGTIDSSGALFIAPILGVNIGQSGEKIYAGSGSLYESTNGGDTWGEIVRFPGNAVSAIAVDGSPIVGLDNGEVRRLPAIIHPANGRMVTDLLVAGPGQYYVTYGGFQADQVQYTGDGGQTWTPLNGSLGFELPLVHVECIAVHPDNPNWIYVGTDLGVFASEDHGQTWCRTPLTGSWLHDGPVNTEVHDLLWHSGNTLVAFTHGRGVFESRILAVAYVDKSSTSSIEGGTLANPYKTINKAEDNTGPGVTFSIKAGVYVEARKIHNRRSKYVSRDGPVQIR